MELQERDPWPPEAIDDMIAEMAANNDSRHWARLWSFVHRRARKIIQERHKARFDEDDLTQDVMCMLREPGRLQSFRGSTDPDVPRRASFTKWLQAIIAYKHKDMAQSARREADRRAYDRHESDSDPPDQPSLLDRVADHWPTPEEQAILNEQVTAVIDALATLSKRDRKTAQAIKAHVEALFSSERYKEIALRLGQSEPSLRQDIFTIRDELRGLFHYTVTPKQTRSNLPTLGEVKPEAPRVQKRAPKRRKTAPSETIRAPLPPADHVEKGERALDPKHIAPGHDSTTTDTSPVVGEQRKGNGPQ